MEPNETTLRQAWASYIQLFIQRSKKSHEHSQVKLNVLSKSTNDCTHRTRCDVSYQLTTQIYSLKMIIPISETVSFLFSDRTQLRIGPISYQPTVHPMVDRCRKGSDYAG